MVDLVIQSVYHRVIANGSFMRTPPLFKKYPYLFRALHISMVTSTDRAMVIG